MGRRKNPTSILAELHERYPHELIKSEMARELNVPRQHYHKWCIWPGTEGNRFPLHLVPLLRKIVEEKTGMPFTKFYRLIEATYPPYPND